MMTHTNHQIQKKPSFAARFPILHSPFRNTWDIAQIELNAYIQQQADEIAPEHSPKEAQQAIISAWHLN